MIEEPDEAPEEYELTKAQYDEWLSTMNERRYNHYIAWFNINIKGADQVVEETKP